MGDPDTLTMLEALRRGAFSYFLDNTNPDNGLARDRSESASSSSISATGFSILNYLLGSERGYITRVEAARYVEKTLSFLHSLAQDDSKNAAGYRGFYYHFLDMESGLRANQSELSMIDSAFFVAAALVARTYFDDESCELERSIRSLAEDIYTRVDWHWAVDGQKMLQHGWKPEGGFLPYGWEGYSEALLLYVLALGSPSSPITCEGFSDWWLSYQWEMLYGSFSLYAGPLFIHQLSHVWLDFRDIQDDFMQSRQFDYFRNSARATCIQREYAIRNPHGFAGYGENCWGITASGGPGPCEKMLHGERLKFYNYRARAVPYGPDDGTLSPWAVAASLPFAPEIVVPCLRQMKERYPQIVSKSGMWKTFNPTFGLLEQGKDDIIPAADNSEEPGAEPWVSELTWGINQGPVALMIENHQSDFIWRMTRSCPYINRGLQRAGFNGGWLS